MLEAEIELRRRIEEVAALRRKLPLGGAVPVDYEFAEGAVNLNDLQSVRNVKLSEIFPREKASLVPSGNEPKYSTIALCNFTIEHVELDGSIAIERGGA